MRLFDVNRIIFFCDFIAQMHALALKDKEEEHAGLLHTAGEIQVRLLNKRCYRNRVILNLAKNFCDLLVSVS